MARRRISRSNRRQNIKTRVYKTSKLRLRSKNIFDKIQSTYQNPLSQLTIGQIAPRTSAKTQTNTKKKYQVTYVTQKPKQPNQHQLVHYEQTQPQKTLCQKRKERKSIMFATKQNGKTGQNKPTNNKNRHIVCKG